MKTETIDITPNYQSLFNLAKEIVRVHVPSRDGQDFVVEMLEYGKRMDKRDNEEEGE